MNKQTCETIYKTSYKDQMGGILHDWVLHSLYVGYPPRRVATCKPGKPRLTSFSETLAVFFFQFLLFRKIKKQHRQKGPSVLPDKTGWLCACHPSGRNKYFRYYLVYHFQLNEVVDVHVKLRIKR